MKQLRQQNAQAKSLSKFLRAENSPSDLKDREQKEIMKKQRPVMRYGQLINYFCEKLKNTANIVKDKIISFLETDKGYSKKATRKEIEKTIKTQINQTNQSQNKQKHQ